jgi:hypothetical protein
MGEQKEWVRKEIYHLFYEMGYVSDLYLQHLINITCFESSKIKLEEINEVLRLLEKEGKIRRVTKEEIKEKGDMLTPQEREKGNIYMLTQQERGKINRKVTRILENIFR